MAWLLSAMILSARIASNTAYRKPAFVVLALGAFLVGMDEISWGQRLVDITPPDFFLARNLQGELTLHNFVILSGYYPIAGVLVLGWALFSHYLRRRPALVERCARHGIVLAPMFLTPLVLAVAWLSLPSDWNFLPERDEAFELLLALLVLALVVHLEGQSMRRAVVVAVALGMLTTGLTWLQPVATAPAAHMNFLASHRYPALGSFRQSIKLYEYILERPSLVNADSRMNHGRVLVRAGDTTRGLEVLSIALKEELARPLRIRTMPPSLRRRGAILKALGRTNESTSTFQRALTRDRQRLANIDDSMEAFGIQLSMALTLVELGDTAAADFWFSRASDLAPTRRMRRRAGVVRQFELVRARAFHL